MERIWFPCCPFRNPSCVVDKEPPPTVALHPALNRLQCCCRTCPQSSPTGRRNPASHRRSAVPGPRGSACHLGCGGFRESAGAATVRPVAMPERKLQNVSSVTFLRTPPIWLIQPV